MYPTDHKSLFVQVRVGLWERKENLALTERYAVFFKEEDTLVRDSILSFGARRGEMIPNGGVE